MRAPTKTAWDPVRRLLPALAASSSSRTRAARAWTSASEQQILRVPVNRQECCHVAGDIDFDKHNNLWLVTGDDNPAGGINGGGFGPSNDQLTDEQQTVARRQRDRRHVHARRFEGQTTAPLAFDATAAQVDSALEALSNIGRRQRVQVTRRPGQHGPTTTVFFRRGKPQANQPQMTANGAGADRRHGRRSRRPRRAAGTSARPVTPAARR